MTVIVLGIVAFFGKVCVAFAIIGIGLAMFAGLAKLFRPALTTASTRGDAGQ